jgi:hypothetical protein
MNTGKFYRDNAYSSTSRINSQKNSTEPLPASAYYRGSLNQTDHWNSERGKTTTHQGYQRNSFKTSEELSMQQTKAIAEKYFEKPLVKGLKLG